jgi:hypothetical protein
MGKTTTDQDQRDDDEDDTAADDEDDAAAASGAGDDADDVDDDAADDDEDDDADEKAFVAKLDADALKFYNKRKAQIVKANADAGRQRRKLRRLTAAGTGTKPPVVKPGPVKTKSDAAPTAAEIKAELRAEFEAEQAAGKVRDMAERQLESMLALPTDPDARERKLTRALRMLDLSNATTRADVADEIADLKDDSPELFKRKRVAKPKTGGVGGPARVAGAGGKAPDKIAGLFDE